MRPTLPLRIRITEAQFYMRHVRTRMPFRYGAASLQYAPILHLRLHLEDESGRTVEGVSADVLPPKWFDKDPDKDLEQNVADLIWGARSALQVALDAQGNEHVEPFELWYRSLPELLQRGQAHGLNRLTTNHGSSLVERAIIEAVGQLTGLTFRDLLRYNVLGIRPATIHPTLKGMAWCSLFRRPARASMFVRHTVGLADPLTETGIPPAERLDDGLPQSLEAYIAQQGIRYFKVKVSGDLDVDLDRLTRIAYLLSDRLHVPYGVSLDGNEQYRDAESPLKLLARLKQNPVASDLLNSILYVEQPFPRDIALDEQLRKPLARLAAFRPVIVDESDNSIDTLSRATALGYSGISWKNCKGIYKSLLNYLLIEYRNRLRTPGSHSCFMTGEDLMNTAVIPFHQDTTILSVLGIEHAERNGHHYVRGLAHLSESERQQCAVMHPDLYEPLDDGLCLRIRQGMVDTRSLQTPGLGVGIQTDFDHLIPLDTWQFSDLSR